MSISKQSAEQERPGIYSVMKEMPDTTGYDAGYQKGFDNGKNAEWSQFWDAYQDNGNRGAYNSCFTGDYWTEENFKPKYDLICSNAISMFENSNISGSLTDLLNNQGVKLDISKTKYMKNMFLSSKFTEIPKLTIDRISEATSLIGMFSTCKNLKKLELEFLNKVTFVASMFNNCIALTDFTVYGEISKLNFNVQWSTLLTHDSLMSIINALEDKSADTSSTVWKVTIGSTNLAKLTDEELNIAYAKGWTVA